jgi:phospholipid/cholesterol/gamma-HCH transport system substrate-binding protein
MEGHDVSPPEDDLPKPPARPGWDREVTVGLFVLISIVTVMIAVFALTDPSTFRGRYLVTAMVPDAGGLRRGDPVELRGVQVGRVRGFEIQPEGVGIRLEIESAFRFPRDSKARVKSSGLLGTMAADIVPGTAAEQLGKGDVIAGEPAERLTDTAGRVAKESEDVLKRMQTLLSDETIDGIETTSTEMAELVTELSGAVTEQRNELAALTKSLRRSSTNLEKLTGPELQEAVQRIEEMTPRLEHTVSALDRSSHSLEVVLARIERGEGTLGRLSKDDSLYESLDRTSTNLNGAAMELQRLAADVRKNPKKYVKLSLF